MAKTKSNFLLGAIGSLFGGASAAIGKGSLKTAKLFPTKTIAAAAGLVALADYGSVQLGRRLEEKYYGREMPHSRYQSRLGAAIGPDLLSPSMLAPMLGLGAAGSYLAGRGSGKTLGKKALGTAWRAAVGAGAGYGIGSAAQSNPDLAAESFNQILVGSTLALGGMAFGSKSNMLTNMAVGAGIGITAGAGLNSGMMSSAMLGAGAALGVQTGIKTANAMRSFRKSKLMNNALTSAVGKTATYAGKKIGVDDLKKKIAELPVYPAFLGPVLFGAGAGAVGGVYAADKIPNIQPEYASQLEVSSRPAMPVDSYTAGLSLGVHRNRKRRKI